LKERRKKEEYTTVDSLVSLKTGTTGTKFVIDSAPRP
jgi:hypothetical protein